MKHAASVSALRAPGIVLLHHSPRPLATPAKGLGIATTFRFRNVATSHFCCGILDFAVAPTVSAAMHATLRHAHETTF
jgi:hypothetical protein